MNQNVGNLSTLDHHHSRVKERGLYLLAIRGPQN